MVSSVTHLTKEKKHSYDDNKKEKKKTKPKQKPKQEFLLNTENSLRWILYSILLQVKNNLQGYTFLSMEANSEEYSAFLLIILLVSGSNPCCGVPSFIHTF